MTIRNLNALFSPKSVAVIGASRKPQAVGHVVAKNLIESGFEGEISLVNPGVSELLGRQCYASIADLAAPPEMAIIATPAQTVPSLIAELAERGTKAAVVITAGFAELGAAGSLLQHEMLTAAQPATLRIIGPNCIGLISTSAKLNASFAHCMPAKGKAAFITQSGAMLTSVLDWAAARGIGFSHLVSLGGMADIDFGDMLDFLASDTQTEAVLLYIESITNARKFMSAARRCARLKPVVVVKSGRFTESAAAARSHTGALAGSDAVADAAFRRAGLLRVQTIDDLFGALEALSPPQHIAGARLGIITNGGGAGVMATDHLMSLNGQLARLSLSTIEKLNGALPAHWSKGNPVDLIGDAGPERYKHAVKALLDDEAVDALLVMNCPVAVASSTAAAEAVGEVVQDMRATGNRKPVLTAWLGEKAVAEARRCLDANGLPQYATPERAVTAFMHLLRRNEAEDLLLQVPDGSALEEADGKTQARTIVKAALEAGREWLTPVEANEILRGYGVPIVEMRVAASADEAQRAATTIGFPVALKILSSDIVHKTDVGAVILNLKDGPSVARAAATMSLRIAEALPDAHIDGFIVQPMASRPGATELIIGLSEDPLFGPVILFGQGGTSVEVVKDQALALPPLNSILVRDLISRTRVSKLLQGYRGKPPANMDAIIKSVLAIQSLAIDVPEIKELDINPLWANDAGVLALDARIRLRSEERPGAQRFAIRPYPQELIKKITDKNGKSYLMRPIRPEDEFALQSAIADANPDDIRMRFFSAFKQLPERLAKRLTQIDYDREMAFVAVDDNQMPAEGVGVVRLALDPDRTRGEYAIIVRRDRQGTGLGFRLMQEMIAYAKSQGVQQIFGDVLSNNEQMLAMAERLGFKRTGSPEPGVTEITFSVE